MNRKGHVREVFPSGEERKEENLCIAIFDEETAESQRTQRRIRGEERQSYS
jgi:hypothetical protein